MLPFNDDVFIVNDFAQQFDFTSDLLGQALSTGRFAFDHVNDGLLRRLAWAWAWGKEPANRRPPDNETAMLAIWRQYHVQIYHF